MEKVLLSQRGYLEFCDSEWYLQRFFLHQTG